MAPMPRYLIVAEIVAPFGVKGEVKANIWTDFPDRLAKRTMVFLGRADEEPRQYALRGIRFHKGQALLTFAGCADRNAAETMRGLLVQIPSADAPALPPGSYYLHQIIGLEAWSPDGHRLGKVVDIITAPSHHIYVISTDSGNILVPAIPDFVRQVDLEQCRIIVDIAPLL
jgi:16S rRNA processing protein RimM